VKGSRSPAAAWRWLPVLPLLLSAACGGPQSLGDSGAKCFRDDDCAPGLICVAPPKDPASRVCSDDPTPLISNVDGPPLATGGDAAMAGSAGAAMAGAGAAGTGGAAGGGAGGTMPAAGAGMGGSATAGTDTGGTDAGGTPAGGTEAGGTQAGGSAGSNAGTDAGGTGGSAAGTAGTASEGGAQ
jgi:hypothetical protein